MKLSRRAYAILWDAHAWAGAISSIVLFAVFFLGTFALFAEQLVPWQEPAFRGPIAVSDDRALELVQKIVDDEAALLPVWFGVSLPTDEEPWLRTWRMDAGGGVVSTWMDPTSGQQVGERSNLGEFLNEMHFLMPIPGGIYVAGVASVVLTLLIGTGLLIQLGKLARELVQFRPEKSLRVLWSDAHKLIGVVTAPALLIFAITGTVLCLSEWLRPVVVASVLSGDDRAVSRITDWPTAPTPTGTRAETPDVRAALHTAQALFPDSELRWFFFDNLGDENAIVHLPGEKGGDLHPFSHVRMSRDGTVVWSKEDGGATHYSRIMETLYGLHFAAWADLPVKVLYGLLSWLVAFGILAGNLLWLERRKQKGHGVFDRLLLKLTAGGCAGLPFAVAVLFVANQLLPLDLGDRLAWEHAAFFVGWGAAVALAFIDPAAGRVSWRLLVTAGAIFLAVPLVDWLRLGELPFVSHSPLVAAAATGLVVMGLVLLGAAHIVFRLMSREPKVARATAGLPAV